MNLTTNFTLEDLTRTNRVRLQAKNLSEGKKEIVRLTRMAETLEVIHAEHPMAVSSGFRCKQLNDALGSSDVSQHRYGKNEGAADFDPLDDDLIGLFEWIYKDSGVKFHQLILEYDTVSKKQWVHLGMPKGYLDGQVFKLDPATKAKIWVVKPIGMA